MDPAHLARWLLMLCVAAVTGCQSAAPRMSTEEAQAALARAGDGKALPPRTIQDIRTQFGAPAPVPADCDARREAHVEALASLGEDISEMRPQTTDFVMMEASTELSRGSFKRAIDLMYRAAGGIPGNFLRAQAHAHASLSIAYGAAGDEGGATRHWQEAARYASLGGYNVNQVGSNRYNVYRSVGRAAATVTAGDVVAAEPALRDALYWSSAFAIGLSSINRAWLHSQLILVLLQQGKLQEAELAAREATREQMLYGALNADTGAVVALLAAVLREQGRLDDAEFVARRAINLFESDCAFPEALSYAQARRILIEVLVTRGEWEEAQAEVVRARADLVANPEVFERLFGNTPEMGLALVYGGDAEAGLALLRKGAEAARAEYGVDSVEHAEARGTLAMGLARAGREDEALAIYTTALPQLLGTVSVDIRLAAANRYSRRRQMLGAALSLMARLRAADHQATRGEDTLDAMFRMAQAIRLTRVQRAVSASAVRAAAQGSELSTLVRDQQDAEVQLANTLDTLSVLTAAPPEQVNPAALDSLRDRAGQLRKVNASLRAAIASEFPAYSDLIRPTPMSLDQVRSALRADDALLRIHAGEDRSLVWAVRPQGEVVFADVDLDRDTLENIIHRLRASVDPAEIRYLADIPVFDVDSAHALYQALLRPVEAGWLDAGHVFLVADAPLDRIPFAMLPRATSGPTASGPGLPFAEYRDVEWLVRSHAFTTLPAVSSLRSHELLRARARGALPFVGFGAPDFGGTPGEDAAPRRSGPQTLRLARRAAPQTRALDSASLAMLPPLPETGEELERIARALGGNAATDVFLGPAANEVRVRSMDLRPFRVIAFATHGLVPGDLDGLDQPALALSVPAQPDDASDGLLTTDEIVGLELGADWAVLSACNTGAADGKGAEAVSGLGRAFLYAGARALLVSNWPVHSESTKMLMTTLFERQIGAPGLARSEALRLAQVELIERGEFLTKAGVAAFSYAHPLFWAAFTVVGDGYGD